MTEMKNFAVAIAMVKQAFPEAEILTEELMSRHTSFRIGGSVPVLFLPKSVQEVQTICRVLTELSIRTLVIGNGTNLLVSDRPPELAVIQMGENMSRIESVCDTVIRAESGAILSKIAMFALHESLTGLEFAHGIPGSLGGAVCMNAGAYGGEMKDVIRKVTVLSPDGVVRDYSGEQCEFAYRQSRFSDGKAVVLSAELALQKGDPTAIRTRMEELSERRKNSQPLQLPSAGSTFKRPATGYAAALIEEAGLKGFAVGDACVSEKHAGFVVNRGSATFEDVLAVMDHVQETVHRKFGVLLVPEVKVIQ